MELNFVEWCKRMGCPQSAVNNSVKKMFSKGLLGLEWEDIIKRTMPINEAIVIKKNVLLYKVKHNIPDKNIDMVKQFPTLRAECQTLEKQIAKLEEAYDKHDFLVKEKLQKLRDIRYKYSKMKAKKNLLKMKQEQTSTQLSDLSIMRSVLQPLKQANVCKDIDPAIINEMLDAVGSLYSGGNKKEVWNKIDEVSRTMDISTLYNQLYQNLKENVDQMAAMKVQKNLDVKSSAAIINIAIGKLCGKHVSLVAQSNLYEIASRKHQQSILDFIRDIEQSTANEISDWLELTLEIEKLKAEKKGLQAEVNKIQEHIYTNCHIFADLDRLTSRIRDINAETEQIVPSVRESLILLKSAPKLILNLKKKVEFVLQKIAELRSATQCDNTIHSLMENDLTRELDMFHDNIDVAALRTINLKGRQRFTKFCFNEASFPIVISQTSLVSLSQFPSFQVPIYVLIDCTKNLLKSQAYKKARMLSDEPIRDSLVSITKSEKMDLAISDLLDMAKYICDKSLQECNRCNDIQYNWIKQTVQKVLEVDNITLDDMTFQEWVKSYSLLNSMISKNL